MVQFLNNKHVIDQIQTNIPPFSGILTPNATPQVVQVRDALYVQLPDLNVDNVCEYGQLERQIGTYERALRIANDMLHSDAVRQLREREQAFATLLNTQTFTPPWMESDEPESLFDMLNDIGDLMNAETDPEISSARGKSEEARLLMRLIEAGINPAALENAKRYMARKEIALKQFKGEVLTLFKGWYEVSVELAVAQNTPRLLQTVLDALLREQKNRSNADNLRSLTADMQNIVDRHAGELRDARIKAAVAALRCLKVPVGEQREAAIREQFGDDADAILMALEQPEDTGDNASNQAEGSFPDWLNDFTPTAESLEPVLESVGGPVGGEEPYDEDLHD